MFQNNNNKNKYKQDLQEDFFYNVGSQNWKER